MIMIMMQRVMMMKMVLMMTKNTDKGTAGGFLMIMMVMMIQMMVLMMRTKNTDKGTAGGLISRSLHLRLSSFYSIQFLFFYTISFWGSSSFHSLQFYTISLIPHNSFLGEGPPFIL